jgi:hypothetical protein
MRDITKVTEMTAVVALKYKKLSGLFIIFSVVYLVQSALITPDQAALDKYHISAAQAIVLTFAIAIPYLAIWFIALIGYLRFRSYTDKIAHTKDGKAFDTMRQGILLLTVWLPFSAVLGSVTAQYYRTHPQATALMVNIDNFANVLILLPAFILLHIGASKLLPIIRRVNYSLPMKAVIIGACLGAAYVFLVFHDPARQFPTKDVRIASYYLPDWAIFFAMVLPRLIMWLLGAQAVYNILLYRRKVKGRLYKTALDNLARGIGWVVFANIVLRSLQSLSGPFSQLSVGLVLIVIYVLLIIMTVGYVLIAKGARRLQLLEEA